MVEMCRKDLIVEIQTNTGVMIKIKAGKTQLERKAVGYVRNNTRKEITILQMK